MSISINDGKATPVAHVFSMDVQQNGPDSGEFVNRANANGPDFWERINSLVTLGKKPNARNVVKEKIHIPVAGTVDGNPAVVGNIDVIVTILADRGLASSVANMQDAVALATNYLANANVKSQIASFTPRSL